MSLIIKFHLMLYMCKGIDFEKEVASLYRSLGKKGVEHNVHLKYDNIHSQFDISYGLNKKYFVECKYRSSGSVPLSDVATFAAKLLLHNISYKRGIMVTNSSYDVRSHEYAKKTKITLIDRDKLSSLKNTSFFTRLFSKKLF